MICRFEILGFSHGHHLFKKKKLMGNKQDSETRRRAPKGHFVVYVGEEMKRFVVPISYLKNPMLQQLLAEAAEEFGFDSQKRIVLPCDESTFQRITDFMIKST